MSMNTACSIEVQARSHRNHAEMQGKSPQDILIEFKDGEIEPQVAMKRLLDAGVFDLERLGETLNTLLDGIEAQDTRAALQRYQEWFRERIIRKSERLVIDGEVGGEDGQHLLNLFSDDGAY